MGLIADYTLQKKISELEDITTETTQNENKEIRQRKKKIENGGSVGCGKTLRGLIYM